MGRLKEMLDGINVTYDERTFETEGSIARLGALVSHLMTWAILTLYNHFSSHPYIGFQDQNNHHCNLSYGSKITAMRGSPKKLHGWNVGIHFWISPNTHWHISRPQAYHSGLLYPRYLFLTYGWYDHNWWLVKDRNLSCTPQERASVLARSFAFLQIDFLDSRNLTTDTGIVSLFSARFHSSCNFICPVLL